MREVGGLEGTLEDGDCVVLRGDVGEGLGPAARDVRWSSAAKTMGNGDVLFLDPRDEAGIVVFGGRDGIFGSGCGRRFAGFQVEKRHDGEVVVMMREVDWWWVEETR